MIQHAFENIGVGGKKGSFLRSIFDDMGTNHVLLYASVFGARASHRHAKAAKSRIMSVLKSIKIDPRMLQAAEDIIPAHFQYRKPNHCRSAGSQQEEALDCQCQYGSINKMQLTLTMLSFSGN